MEHSVNMVRIWRLLYGMPDGEMIPRRKEGGKLSKLLKVLTTKLPRYQDKDVIRLDSNKDFFY